MPLLCRWSVRATIAGVNRVRIQIERAAAGVLLLSLLCAVPVRATAPDPAAPARPTLTVFAAAGTTDALTALLAQYEERTGVRVNRSFAASSTLARQIEAGARADIFVSASADWMDYLQQRDLLMPGTRRDLATNRLVLIVPASAREGHSSPPDRGADGTERCIQHTLLAIEGRLALADPAHVPAGIYARQALESFDCYEAVRPRIVKCSTPREALALVEAGQVAAGIVYRSDAGISRRVRVMGVFPQSSHERIAFQVAVLRADRVRVPTGDLSPVGVLPRRDTSRLGSPRPEAEELFQFLTSPGAVAILAAHGFDPDAISSCETRLTQNAQRRTHNELTHDARRTVSWLPTVREWATIHTSMKVAAGCVAVLAIPGILLAYLLARKDFRGKILVETLIYAPLVIPPVVVGYLLLVLLGNNGLAGRWLHRTFGIELAFTLNGAVIAAAVMSLPLMVRSVQVAMELVDRRLEEAARTLGAGPIRTFLSVTVPLALPGIISGTILAFARGLGEFGATAVFVGSIEGQSRTLPLAIYSHLQTASGEASAGRLIVFSILLSLAAVAISEVFVKRAKRSMRVNHAA